MKRKVLFIDMDGVLADFNSGVGRPIKLSDKPIECLQKGFYRNLKVIPHAKEAVALLEAHFNVYIASKPKSENPYCLQEKMEWVREHFPTLEKKVFFTPNKVLLDGFALIDDHTRWSGFNGKFIHFTNDSNWLDIAHELIKEA